MCRCNCVVTCFPENYRWRVFEINHCVTHCLNTLIPWSSVNVSLFITSRTRRYYTVLITRTNLWRLRRNVHPTDKVWIWFLYPLHIKVLQPIVCHTDYSPFICWTLCVTCKPYRLVVNLQTAVVYIIFNLAKTCCCLLNVKYVSFAVL